MHRQAPTVTREGVPVASSPEERARAAAAAFVALAGPTNRAERRRAERAATRVARTAGRRPR